MSVQRISIDIPTLGAATVTGKLNPQAQDRQSVSRLAALLEEIAGGVTPAKVRLNVGAVPAVGTVAFSSFVEDDTVTVNGVVLTGKDSPSGGTQFRTGVSDEDSANALRTLINASTTAKIAGTVYATRRGTVALSAFVANDTVTVNGVVFTGKASPSGANQFLIGDSDAETAQHLLEAIAANPDVRIAGVSVTRSSATLTFNFDGTMTLAASAHATVTDKTIVFTSLIGGQIGNLQTLAISAHGSASSPSGGTEGTETLFTVA